MDSADSYLPRVASRRIETALSDTPVVLVVGPRQAGKSTLVRQFSGPERPYLTLDDETVRESARFDPSGFVRQLDLAIIDEVQRAPELLISLKKAVDEDRRPGRFLLTGSADLMTLPTVSESLAGRMEIVPLLPLSQGEIRRKRPGFLKRVLEGRPPDCLSPVTGDELVKTVLSGGYPEMLRRKDPGRRRAWVRDYVEALFLRDVREISNLEHRDRLLPLFRIMALQSGQIPNLAQWGGQIGLDAKTTKSYVSVLERLFLIHRLPAWHSDRTSRLIKSPKLHLVDSGIQANLTGATEETILRDRSRLGPLLETFAVSEILKQASWEEGIAGLFHFRDKDQEEVDLIVEEEGGRIVGIEIKAAATVTPRDFRGLKRLELSAGQEMSLGLVLYDGDRVLPFGSRLFAAPLSSLWSDQTLS
ncbi:MAG: ATP-binding protein [Nitrospiraceae bacterium]|nr:ATP-binding protein [Nitrospiraceae bacterium]